MQIRELYILWPFESSRNTTSPHFFSNQRKRTMTPCINRDPLYIKPNKPLLNLKFLDHGKSSLNHAPTPSCSLNLSRVASEVNLTITQRPPMYLNSVSTNPSSLMSLLRLGITQKSDAQHTRECGKSLTHEPFKSRIIAGFSSTTFSTEL